MDYTLPCTVTELNGSSEAVEYAPKSIVTVTLVYDSHPLDTKVEGLI